MTVKRITLRLVRFNPRVPPEVTDRANELSGSAGRWVEDLHVNSVFCLFSRSYCSAASGGSVA
jgi:hypothetical protein